MESGIQDSNTAISTNAVVTETERITRENIRTRSPPRYIKWFAFKERGWISGHQKSSQKEPCHLAKCGELSKSRYPEIPQRRDMVYRLKRPGHLEIFLGNDDILKSISGLREIQESGASDISPHGNSRNEDIVTLPPRKRVRFSEPQNRPSLAHEVVDCSMNDDNDEDKENNCPTAKPLTKDAVSDDRRKRKPLGTHKPAGYLDAFSKVKALNSSPKQRINVQWKVLDDRISRTLRHFRGYHREQSDWEYEI